MKSKPFLIHFNVTNLHSRLASKTAGTVMTYDTGLIQLPWTMETFLDTGLTTQSPGARPGCVASLAVLARRATSLYSRFARVGAFTLAEDRTSIPG